MSKEKLTRMWKNVALFLVSCLASVALAEGMLRVTFDLRGMTYTGHHKIPDPVLKGRIPAGAYGHDANGLRNPKVPDSVDILAVGDSMTYGFMASAKESWPAQLATLTNTSVYNAGMGGYGPLQYLHMVRTLAPKLKPKQIILMVYIGNDFYNAYDVAYKLEHWKDYRKDGELPPKKRQRRPRSLLKQLKFWLERNTILYNLTWDAAFQLGLNYNPSASPFFRFTHLGRNFGFPDSYLSVLHQKNQKEGSRITKRALGEIATYCAERDIDLLVVLKPHRLHLHYPYFRDQLTASQDAVMKMHLQIWETATSELIDFLSTEDIPYTNLYAPIALASETQAIYPATDNHPNREGYRVIAEALAEVIDRR